MSFRYVCRHIGFHASPTYSSFLPLSQRLGLRAFRPTSVRTAKSKPKSPGPWRETPRTRPKAKIEDGRSDHEKIPRERVSHDRINRRPPLSRRLLRMFLYALPWIPIYVVFNSHVATVMSVTGPSMWPLLNGGHKADEPNRDDKVLVNLLYPLDNLQRGMVVVFRSPRNPERVVIKRIVALAGDAITPSEEECTGGRKEIIVPYNHMWVEGDGKDPKKNLDSNTYGPITQSLILGKVSAVIWPLNRMSIISWKDWTGCDRLRENAVATINPDDEMPEPVQELIASGEAPELAKIQAALKPAR